MSFDHLILPTKHTKYPASILYIVNYPQLYRY